MKRDTPSLSELTGCVSHGRREEKKTESGPAARRPSGQTRSGPVDPTGAGVGSPEPDQGGKLSSVESLLEEQGRGLTFAESKQTQGSLKIKGDESTVAAPIELLILLNTCL